MLNVIKMSRSACCGVFTYNTELAVPFNANNRVQLKNATQDSDCFGFSQDLLWISIVSFVARYCEDCHQVATNKLSLRFVPWIIVSRLNLTCWWLLFGFPQLSIAIRLIGAPACRTNQNECTKKSWQFRLAEIDPFPNGNVRVCVIECLVGSLLCSTGQQCSMLFCLLISIQSMKQWHYAAREFV